MASSAGVCQESTADSARQDWPDRTPRWKPQIRGPARSTLMVGLVAYCGFSTPYQPIELLRSVRAFFGLFLERLLDSDHGLVEEAEVIELSHRFDLRARLIQFAPRNHCDCQVEAHLEVLR